MRKAEQFYAAAETIRDVADDEAETRDAFVTLCVHAGIAAADVLCCLSLGRRVATITKKRSLCFDGSRPADLSCPTPSQCFSG